jgi:asparagine synthase (glutamine-hydrolysing)
MCGIGGVIGQALGAARRREVVERMMQRLVHRGPDDAGLFESAMFTLGHRRLAIIDVETGHQPMLSADGRYALTFNGEIYNYLELREELRRDGALFRTHSDTEVLLESLIREGASALQRLNGMFAFAFVDTHKNEWLLVRDPLGIKPLYYAALEDEIVFASEVKAILAHPRIRAEADWQSLQQYLTFQFCIADRTLFRGISKLEPGCFAEGCGPNLSRVVRYWDTRYDVDEGRSESGFVEELRHLLDDAARLQLRSDVPVGAHLSGGLDSTAIALAAARQAKEPMKVFHGTFAEGPHYDESSYARIAADAAAADMILIRPSAKQFVEDMPKLIHAMDEPAAGPGLFPQYRVSKHAAEHVKVVLGGQGGDEIFGGYARYLVGYLEQALKGAIFGTQEEGRHIVTLSSILPNLSILREYQPLMQQFWRDGLFGEMDARYFRLLDRTPDLDGLLTPDAISGFDREALYAQFQRIFNHPETKSYFNKMTHFDLKTLLPALLHVEDRVSMAVSLESRVPLLDTRIVDLVTSMPPRIKFSGGRAKHALREAVGARIPKAIAERQDKMGFPVPLREWMQAGPVRDFVCDVVLSKRARERGLFDHAMVERLVNREQTFGRQLWGVLCAELWHNVYIDPQ